MVLIETACCVYVGMDGTDETKGVGQSVSPSIDRPFDTHESRLWGMTRKSVPSGLGIDPLHTGRHHNGKQRCGHR